MLDRLARPGVLGLNRLEQVEDLLCARRRPQRQQPVIHVGEAPAAADRHEAWVSDLREDHGWNFYPHQPGIPVRRACERARPGEAREPAARSLP